MYYNDEFDKELIDYLYSFFDKSSIKDIKVRSLYGYSNYEIRFANKCLVLKLVYVKSTDDCEAQIRISSILLKDN